MKMNEYYGEKKIGITYTKEFFNKHHTEFLWAYRKADHTKAGRTMPKELCILGFDYDGKQWWDVFSRSAYGTFWGRKRAGLRFDQWWGDQGEKPSYRLPTVENGKESNNQKGESRPKNTYNLRSDVRADILKEVDVKLDAMQGTFQKTLDTLADSVKNLNDLVAELTRRQVSPIST